MGFTGVNDLRIFKQITGGDAVQVEIKGGNIFPYRFKGLLCFCANALPNFGGDKGSHVYERFVPIPCNNVIHKDKQDATLLEKMFAESEAIINDRWIPAARQVIENGYRFDIPAVSVEALEQYKVDNSPVITFFTEYCKMREPGDTYSDGYTCVSIYNAFTIWYRDEYSGRTPVSKQAFRKEISDYLKLANIEKRKSKSRYYIFTLNVE
jgi:phage/plasmid-associated DNA primase